MNKIEIIDGKLEDLKLVYQKMINEFAEDELKSYEHLQSLLKTKNYKLLLAKNHNELVGYAFILELTSCPAVWLDYLAITPKYQNLGYGSHFFNKIAKTSGVFIEMEIPGQSEAQEKRIRFYERLGAKRLPVSYELPTEKGGFPMYLYFKRTENMPPLQVAQLQTAIREAFDNIHSDVKDRDAILKRILHTIES